MQVLFEEIAKSLLVYGPLGVFCVVAMYIAIQKDKLLIAQQADHLEKMEAQQADHLEKMEAVRAHCQKEMQEFQERYILKSETYQTKYYELANSLQAVIKALQEKSL